MKQLRQEHLVSADPRQSESSPDTDDFQNDKIFMKIRSAFSRIWAKLSKNSLSHNVEKSFEKFLDPGPQANDFQNLMSPFFVHGFFVM